MTALNKKVSSFIRAGGAEGNKCKGWVFKIRKSYFLRKNNNFLGGKKMKNASVFLVMSVLTLSVLQNAYGFSGAGSGTETDPYIIADVYQLQEMNNDLDAWYELGNDIDASDTINWNWGEGFLPIGSFMGKFDGENYAISDLYINRHSQSNIGLFGNITGSSEIRNVRLLNINIIGNSEIGGLVGVNYGTIKNSHSIGNISGYGAVGGLVGRNGGTISKSYAEGNVVGINVIGGLVGWNAGGTISESYASGAVTGHHYIGGLVGYLEQGNVLDSYSTGNAAGWQHVGGLCGLLGPYYFGTINNCYAAGNVTGDSLLGGLADCYPGWDNGGCLNSYWDIETSGQNTSAGGEGKTTAEMKTKSTFNNWDFVNIWMICEGIDYPRLLWQGVTCPPADPVELLVELAQDVIALNLQQGISNSLDSKLQAAMQALDDINENNDVAAINTLQAFINAVEAQRGSKISEANADALITSAQEIINLLSME
jgi:hypothetical protein